MPSRFEKLVAIAAKEPTESNVELKVCPRCNAPSSRFDTNCQRCAKRGRLIEQTIKVQELEQKRLAGEKVTKEEQEFLKRNERLLDRDVSQEDLDFLEEAPYELPGELVVVRPTYKNRLQFFLDRMQAEGRKVTTTHAAAKFLKFDEGGFVNKKDFIDFATDHGVRPLMSADWESLYAAWRIEDIIKLSHERMAERSAKKLTETKPGEVLTSAQAFAAIGMAGARDFIEFAKTNGIKPAQAFGEKAEQIVWHAEDVESMRRLWETEKDIAQLEQAEERIKRELAIVMKPPMKYPQMLRMRELNKDTAAILDSLTKARQQHEREQAMIQELATKREEERAGKKKASDSRLARILAVAAGPSPTKAQRTALVDKIYDISGRAIREILSHKDLANLLEPDRLEQASDGLLSFDEIMGSMVDALNVTPHEGAKLPPDELKRLNTKPGAKNCASCGSPLSDPGMGPTFKHCPTCEP